MKQLILIFIVLISIVSCGGNDDKKANQKSEKLTIETISDSVGFKEGDQQIISTANIEYPKDVEQISKDLAEIVKTTGQGDDFEGYPDTIKVDTTDLTSLVKYLVQSKAAWLKGNFTDGEPSEIPLSYELNVYVLEETDDFITMAVKDCTLYGGPGPRITEYGITYLKADGKKIGTGDLNPTKTQEIKDELLNKITTYIGELIKGEDFKVDDVLYFKNGTSENKELEFPFNGMYIDGDSIVFPYQAEEITSRTFGIPEVKLSLKQMKEKEWLGKTLSDIVK